MLYLEYTEDGCYIHHPVCFAQVGPYGNSWGKVWRGHGGPRRLLLLMDINFKGIIKPKLANTNGMSWVQHSGTSKSNGEQARFFLGIVWFL